MHSYFMDPQSSPVTYSIMWSENSTEPKILDLPYVSSSSQMNVVHLFLQGKYERHFNLLKVFVSSEMHFSFVALEGQRSDSTSLNAGG